MHSLLLHLHDPAEGTTNPYYKHKPLPSLVEQKKETTHIQLARSANRTIFYGVDYLLFQSSAFTGCCELSFVAWKLTKEV